MIYVSFVEIFVKSLDAYTDAVGEQLAPLVTMFTFFGGVAVMAAVSLLVAAAAALACQLSAIYAPTLHGVGLRCACRQ